MAKKKAASVESMEFVQLFAALADNFKFKALANATPKSKTYKVELEGKAFRALMAFMGKARDWRSRLISSASAEKPSSHTLDEFLKDFEMDQEFWAAFQRR